MFVVLDESVAVVPHGVRRVQENEVTRPRPAHQLLEVPLVQFGTNEKSCRRQKIVGGAHNLVTFTDRHVKLALSVNAIYSVEARPI